MKTNPFLDDPSKIVLKLEASPAVQLLAEAEGLLKGLVDAPDEIVNRFIDIFHSRIELFSIKRLAAFGAGELRFGLQPSDRLLELMATLRALDGKAGIV